MKLSIGNFQANISDWWLYNIGVGDSEAIARKHDILFDG